MNTKRRKPRILSLEKMASRNPEAEFLKTAAIVNPDARAKLLSVLSQETTRFVPDELKAFSEKCRR